MIRSRSLLAASAAALLIAPAAAHARGGAGTGGGATGGGGGGTPAAAPVGSIRAVNTTATCTDGYTFAVTFRKGFDKRVEEVLTFSNSPAGYWEFALRNDTTGTSMGGFAGGFGAAPSMQITNLTTNVPTGPSTLTLSVTRSALASAAQFGPAGAVEATCSATATVVG